MSFLKQTILLAITIVLLLPGLARTEQIHAPIVADEVQAEEPEVPLSPVEYADKYTTQYGVDPVIFKKVMWCESSNNPNAVGDGGRARNVMQFHKPTFEYFSSMLGEELDYNSYKDQIKLAAYMFSIGKQGHWTCYNKVLGH